MIVDEEEGRIYLRATKDMEEAEDVFLVDHAWTFKQRQALKVLRENEKLRERLDNILKAYDKRAMPVANPFAKAKPSLDEYLKKVKESAEP